MPDIYEETRAVNVSINELILAQLRDLKEGQRDLNRRMDRIETRMDRLEVKIDTTRQELNSRMDRIESRIDNQEAKIDRLANKIDSSTNHGQIATISTIGIGVAAASSTIALLYSLFAK